MPTTQEMSFATIDPGEVARWVEARADTWWTIDGDPLLTAELDLPCPASEIADALRRHSGHGLLVRTPETGRAGDRASAAQLDALAHTHRGERTLLLRWADGGDPWLLAEYATDDEDEGRPANG